MDEFSQNLKSVRSPNHRRQKTLLGSIGVAIATAFLAGCGGGNEPAPTPGPSGGGNILSPVSAPGLPVTANENFAGADFVDVEKYNQAIENYNNTGSTLAGGNP